jgi:separase
VDARRAFYVLNPGGDLSNTQQRLTAFIDKFKWWNGLVAQVPTRDQVQEALEVHDLFLYMGHGSGGRYFGRSSIRESKCKAVSILMGCCRLVGVGLLVAVSC